MSRIQQLKGKLFVGDTDNGKGTGNGKTAEARSPFSQSHLRLSKASDVKPSETSSRTSFERSRLAPLQEKNIGATSTTKESNGTKPLAAPSVGKPPPDVASEKTRISKLQSDKLPAESSKTTSYAFTLSTTQRSVPSKEKSPSAINEREPKTYSQASEPSQSSDVPSSAKTVIELKDKVRTLESENSRLVHKLKLSGSDLNQSTTMVSESETAMEELKHENTYLKDELRALQAEMDEMQDQFKEDDEQEYRDLQKELETMAKNYRIAQFKLKKAERRLEQVEAEREQGEERMRQLHESMEEGGDRNHIKELEQELQMSKEVSLRLHNEIENLEEKCSKTESENERYIDELQQFESKAQQQEKDIKKLQQALEDTRTVSGSPMVSIPPSKLGGETPDKSGTTTLQVPEHPKLGTIRQSSQDYDISQVMRDLYDSMEREQDLKEQLKFSEEEAKIVRRKLADLENENDSLMAQLQKMSGKTLNKPGTKRSLSRDRPKPGDEDDADTDYKIQVELAEQESQVLRKRINELSSENENLSDEVKFLQEKLRDGGHEDGSHRSAADLEHYDAAMRVMVEEIEDLKWKLIEKDRELELARIINSKQSGETAADKRGSLLRSRSLEMDSSESGRGITIKQQLELLHEQAIVLKERNEVLHTENEQLKVDNDYLRSVVPGDDRTPEDYHGSPRTLKARIDELEEEKGDLMIIVKSREVENSSLEQQIAAYECELDDIKRTSELAELGHKEEIDGLKRKNELLSSCLQMVNQRTGIDQRQRAALVSAGQSDILHTNGDNGAPSIGKNWDDNFNKQMQNLKTLLESERRPKASQPTVILGSFKGPVSWNVELQECIGHLQDSSEQINSIGERLSKVTDLNGDSSSRHSLTRQTEKLRSEIRGLTATCDKYKKLMDTLQTRLEQVSKSFAMQQQSWDREKARIVDDAQDNVNFVRQSKQKLLEKEGLVKSKERQLEQVNKEIESYKNKISECDKKLKDEKEALSHNAKLLENLDKEVKRVESILSGKNIEIYEKDEQCRLLRLDCKKRDEAVKQKTDELKALSKKLQTFEGKIISYVSQVGSLEQQLKQKDFELGKSEKKYKAVKTENELAQKKYDDIVKEHRKIELVLEAEKQKLKKDLVDSAIKCTKIETELKRQKEILMQERNSWAKTEEGLKLDLVNMREQLSSLERSKTMKDSEAVTMLTSEKRDLQRARTKLQGEIEQLKKNIVHVEEGHAYDMDELQGILVEKTELIQTMRDTEEDYKLRLGDLQKKMDDQTKELQKTRASLMQRGADDLRAMQSAQIRKLRQEKMDLRKEYLLELEQHEDAKSDLAQLRNEFEREMDGWSFEKELLTKHVYESKDMRTQVITLQKMVENLKTKLQESENAKEELIMMHSTEQLDWDIRAAELQTTINKLEEQKPLPRFPIKAKDKRKAEIENNWERERSELRRIVAEAHAICIDQKQKLDSATEGETLQKLVESRLLREEDIHKRELSIHETMIRELHQKLNSLLGLKMELAETKTRFKREEAAWDLEKQRVQATLEEARERQKGTQDTLDQLLMKLKCIHDAEGTRKEKELETGENETTQALLQLVSDVETRQQQEKDIPVLEIKLKKTQQRPSTKYPYPSPSSGNKQYPSYSPLKAPPAKYPDTPPSLLLQRPTSTSSPRSSFASKTGAGLIKSLSIDSPSSAKLWASFDEAKGTSLSEKSSPMANDSSPRANGEVSIVVSPPGSAGRPSTLPLSKYSSTGATSDLRRQVAVAGKSDLTKPSPTTARKKFLENFLSLNFGKRSRKDHSRDTQSERGRSESPAPVIKPSTSKSSKLLQKSHSLDESSASSVFGPPSAAPSTPKEKKKTLRKFFQRSSSMESPAPPPDPAPATEMRRYSSEEELASRAGKSKPGLFKRFRTGMKK